MKRSDLNRNVRKRTFNKPNPTKCTNKTKQTKRKESRDPQLKINEIHVVGSSKYLQDAHLHNGQLNENGSRRQKGTKNYSFTPTPPPLLNSNVFQPWETSLSKPVCSIFQHTECNDGGKKKSNRGNLHLTWINILSCITFLISYFFLESRFNCAICYKPSMDSSSHTGDSSLSSYFWSCKLVTLGLTSCS